MAACGRLALAALSLALCVRAGAGLENEGVAGQGYTEHLALRPLPDGSVHAVFNLTVRARVDAPSALLFPKRVSQVAAFCGLQHAELSIARGTWQAAAWGGVQAVPCAPATTLKASFSAATEAAKAAAFRALARELTEMTAASLLFFDDAAEPEFARAHTVRGVDGHDFLGFLPAEETLCTENLTPMKLLLPTRGKAGLSQLIEPQRFFKARYHALHLRYARTSWDGVAVESLSFVAEAVFRRGAAEGFAFALRDGGRCALCDGGFSTASVVLPEAAAYQVAVRLAGRVHRQLHRRDGGTVEVYFKEGVQEAGWPAGALDGAVVAAPASTTVHQYSKDKGDAEGTLTVRVQPRAGATSVRVLLALPQSFVRPYVSSLRVVEGAQRWGAHPVSVVPEAASGNTLAVSVLFRIRGDDDSDGEEAASAAANNGTRVVTEGEAEAAAEATPFAFRLLFDKKLLRLSQYPPDANRMYLFPPVVVWDAVGAAGAAAAYSPLPAAVTLPTPDFSMPFNIITLSCTAMAMAFGTVFTHVTKDYMSGS